MFVIFESINGVNKFVINMCDVRKWEILLV